MSNQVCEASTSQPNTYTRRAFIQMLLAAPLALGTTTLLPEEAEAAIKTIKVGYTVLHVPSIWKKRLSGQGRSHGSGIYNYDLVHKGTGVHVLMVTEGNYRIGEARGKASIKYRRAISWKIKRGKVSSLVDAYNVPLIIWESAHGQGYYSITEKQAKELLKISTGGRIKYATLVKWSKAKAKSKGAKAVRAWVGAKVVKKIKIR